VKSIASPYAIDGLAPDAGVAPGEDIGDHPRSMTAAAPGFKPSLAEIDCVAKGAKQPGRIGLRQKPTGAAKYECAVAQVPQPFHGLDDFLDLPDTGFVAFAEVAGVGAWLGAREGWVFWMAVTWVGIA
jgi:hypothetical protein